MKNFLNMMAGQQPAGGCNSGCDNSRGASSVPNAACSPFSAPVGWRPCQVPIISPYCADDNVLQYGRARFMNVPEFALFELIARAANYSPREPLSVTGQKGAGELDLDIALAAASPATTQGSDYLFPAFMFEVTTSDDVGPSTIGANIQGTFEDGQPWTQTIVLSPGHIGLSRFLVFGSRTSEGDSYPSLFRVSRDLELTGVGDPIPLTAGTAPNDATSITPTDGIRAVQREFSVNITDAAQGTNFRVECITPVSSYWDWMLAVLARSVGAGK